MSDSAESCNSFALKVYHALLDDVKEGNIFFSPASIFAALCMTYCGTRGTTSEQMKNVMSLKYTNIDDNLHKDIQLMWKDMLGSDSGATFKLANKLWLQSGMNVRNEFQKTLETYYHASSALVDFAAQSDPVRLEINKWVEDHTERKIKDLIAPGMLNSLTRFVITNAIYFKGNWNVPFDKEKTQPAPFFYDGKKSSDVQMMHLVGKEFAYYCDEDYKCQVLSLPYVGSSLLMVVVLPDETDGLPELENKLYKEGISSTNLLKWVTARRIKVEVSIPRFKFTWQNELSGVLSGLGMRDLFDADQCDLSGISGTRDLFVKYCVHKAFVEVNEEGTEAAAATAVIGMLRCAMPMRPPVFKADHPFLFAIFDKNTSAVVFMGRLQNPCDLK